MNILIATHHLHGWAGSELVCIELYEELTARGHQTFVFCPFAEPKFTHRAFGDWRVVTSDPARVDLGAYDLVITVHQTVTRLLQAQARETLLAADRPVFAFLYLSSFDPLEAPGPLFQHHFTDIALANSVETRAALEPFGVTGAGLFQNPAPAAFAGEASTGPLRRLLVVSNHPPAPLKAAIGSMEAQGIEVTQIGNHGWQRRVTPQDIAGHDAVLTIGKTVQYALRGRRPVFCYDHFGGPGWLNADTFSAAERTNFSGRSAPEVRDADALAHALLSGFDDARSWMAQVDPGAAAAFQLEAQVDALLAQVDQIRAQRAPHPMAPAELDRIIALEHAQAWQIDREYGGRRGLHSASVPREAWDVLPDFALTRQMLRDPAPGEAMVIAVFSYRYDAHLVPDLLANITPSIHGYVALDDRNATDTLSNEAQRQAALFDAARQMGADWLFVADPDERYEDRLADHIHTLTHDFGPVIWTFDCREMFSATHFRTDGIWANRPRARLIPCLPGMEPDSRALHGSWTRNGCKLQMRASGLEFYHLRMATPERRNLRRVLYAVNDAARAFQKVGYDYLDDERGMVLRPVAPESGFSPPHVEDHGLWAAEAADYAPDDVVPDPLPCRMQLLLRCQAGAAHGAALATAQDMVSELPDDADFDLLVAECALNAGDWTSALHYAQRAATNLNEAPRPHQIIAEAAGKLGQADVAKAAQSTAQEMLPFDSQQDWSRWSDGAGTQTEGDRVADASLAVVVIGLGAPDNLNTAVTALRTQSEQAEIVVVNSGGGDAKAVLADHLDVIRLIEVPQRLMPGAARNIGIDASAAPFVAFLASDCQPSDGWVATRSALHRSGLHAVAADVAPQTSEAPAHVAASCLYHSARQPDAVVPAKQAYSLSYARHLFASHGYFPDGLRVGEDTALNAALSPAVEIGSAPGLWVTHTYPDTVDDLTADAAARARLRVMGSANLKATTPGGARRLASDMHDTRRDMALQALRARDDTRPEVLDALKAALKAEQDATQTALQDKLAIADLLTTGTPNDLRRAHDLNPHSAEVHRALARQAAQDNDIDLFMRHSRRALSIAPDDLPFLNFVRTTLVAAKRHQDLCALTEYLACISPRGPALVHMARGLGTLRLRPFKLMMLHRAFVANPGDVTINRVLANVHTAIGNTQASAARARFEKAAL